MIDGEGAQVGRALARPSLPTTMERWRVVIAPGHAVESHESNWVGALVLVERGTLRVECRAGGAESFGGGSIVALAWLPLHRLCCVGDEEVRLLAVRRRGADAAESRKHKGGAAPMSDGSKAMLRT